MDSSDNEILNKVKEILKPLELEEESYKDIMNRLNNAMKRGLDLETRQSASVKMYPSYVTKLPNGKECGQYLALDLGGTNYRVILVTLAGQGTAPKIEERTYAIPRDKMTGTGEELFEYIATTLGNFIRRYGVQDSSLNLGFTFSFPCEQHGINQAYLVRWTKGFDAKGVVGVNVAELLQKAIDKIGLNVKCVAVVNDTVGTLASCALEDPRCAIGLIVGTGTNAAYIERREAVPFMRTFEQNDEHSSVGKKCEHVVVNMEWGAFGEEGELDPFLTDFDRGVDKDSLHPRKQLFEKLVSGMYLGELVRCILIHLVKLNLLFGGELPESLKNQHSFHTKYITETERDPPHLFYSTHYMLTEDLNVQIVEPVDDRVVRYVCEMVSKRAAFLAGAGIAAVLHHIKRKEVTVGIDGSLYKFHPRFRERMTDIIDRLRPAETKFRLRLSEDGSGKGAAAIAAAASRTDD